MITNIFWLDAYLVIALVVTLVFIKEAELVDILASMVVGLFWPIILPLRIYRLNNTSRR